MPVTLTHELTILCEGAADQNFLRKMVETRALFPPFNFLPTKEFYGSTNFGKMLLALKGDSHAFSRMKGVLVVADSHDDPMTTFVNIRTQIQAVGGYPVPQQLLDVAPSTAGHPAVAVMLLPDEASPGALESLFIRAITSAT